MFYFTQDPVLMLVSSEDQKPACPPPAHTRKQHCLDTHLSSTSRASMLLRFASCTLRRAFLETWCGSTQIKPMTVGCQTSVRCLLRRAKRGTFGRQSTEAAVQQARSKQFPCRGLHRERRPVHRDQCTNVWTVLEYAERRLQRAIAAHTYHCAWLDGLREILDTWLSGACRSLNWGKLAPKICFVCSHTCQCQLSENTVSVCPTEQL